MQDSIFKQILTAFYNWIDHLKSRLFCKFSPLGDMGEQIAFGAVFCDNVAAIAGVENIIAA